MSSTRSLPSRMRPLERAPVGTVIIAEHVGMLQELATRNPLFKFRAAR